MAAEPNWVPVITYSALFEADAARVLLETAGIPVLVKGSDVGMFGGAFSGPSLSGVTLLVPADRVEEAREQLPPPFTSE